MPSISVWGIHAGKTGDAQTLFSEASVIALGWEAVPDLHSLPPEKEAFQAAVMAAYPTWVPARAAQGAGQLRRFAYELAINDIVVFSSKADWTYRIGRVIGEYFYAGAEEPYCHRRKVDWLKTLSRDEFSTEARNEFGAARSFFTIRRHADEVLAKLGLTLDDLTAEEPEPDDVLTADDVEVQTRNFVLDAIKTAYPTHALEDFVASLLTAMGYRAEATKKSGDHGVDVVAGKGPLGLDPPILKVQVKSGQGATGEPDLVKLKGSTEPTQGERSIVVSLGGFTPQAIKWAAQFQWFLLVGPDELAEMVLAHYPDLPAQDQANLPLRRVYAPQI